MAKSGNNLTYQQLKYLAARPWTETDGEAASAAGVAAQTVCTWKQDPYFVEQLESVWRGDIERTREIMARLRDKAALKLEKLIDSRDVRTARAAAVDVLDRAGMRPGDSVTVQVSPELARLLGEAGGGDDKEGMA